MCLLFCFFGGFFCKNPNFVTKPRCGNRLTAIEVCMLMCEKCLLASTMLLFILTHPLNIPSDGNRTMWTIWFNNADNLHAQLLFALAPDQTHTMFSRHVKVCVFCFSSAVLWRCFQWMPFLGGHFTWFLLGYLTLRDDFVIVCSFNHLVIDVEMWLKLANVSRENKYVGTHNFYQLLKKGFKSQSSFTVHHRVNLLCFFSHLAVPHHPPQFDKHCSKPSSMLVYLFDFCSWLWVWWFTWFLCHSECLNESFYYVQQQVSGFWVCWNWLCVCTCNLNEGMAMLLDTFMHKCQKRHRVCF